jgi:shikimate kinase
MKIFLIGLMGSGKSILGKKISQSIQLPFIDLDNEIEKQEGLKVSEIFSTRGEEYFRTLEAAALRKHSKTNEFVMATGGGVPCFHDNMNFITQTGTSIFLNTPIKDIIKRMDGLQKDVRPILATVPDEQLEDKLISLLQQRLSFYKQAHITINGATATVEEILQLLHARK